MSKVSQFQLTKWTKYKLIPYHLMVLMKKSRSWFRKQMLGLFQLVGRVGSLYYWGA